MATVCLPRRTDNHYDDGVQRVDVPSSLSSFHHYRKYFSLARRIVVDVVLIQEHIIGEIYTGTTRRTKQARRTKRDELDRELRSWKQSLPPHLCFNPREPVHIPTPMIFSLQ